MGLGDRPRPINLMKKRIHEVLGVTIAILASCLIQAKQSNVLFIICDDLNVHLSAAGYDQVPTPELDGLASESITFTRAYCQYPVCGPSRASLLSGLYPESTGVLNNTVDIRETRPGTVSLPQRFKDSGYWTVGVGKIFHNSKFTPTEEAWDEFIKFTNDKHGIEIKAQAEFEAKNGSIDDRKNRQAWKAFLSAYSTQTHGQTPPGYGPTDLSDEQHMDGKNARQVADWLDNQSYGEKPFFIACGIQKPHVPFLAPQKYFDRFPLGEIEYDPIRLDDWEDIPEKAASLRFRAFGFEMSKENDSLRREYMQAYHACISFIDTQLGFVFDALKESGHWEDTIIVFTSDHGYHLGEHSMWGKVTLFEECARVPMMMRVPGMTPAGVKSDALVEHVDFYPTLLELCELDAASPLQGKSVVPLLKNPEMKGKDYAYTVVSRGQQLGRSIRSDRWRYAEWFDAENAELYDLKEDPKEYTNLARNPEYASRLKIMRKALAEAKQSAGRER
jgi:iduronate 2-sulfatase